MVDPMESSPSLGLASTWTHALPAFDRGCVLVRLLRHPEELDDRTLLALGTWNSGELERMGRFKHRGAKTSWCVARWLLEESMGELAGDRGMASRLMLGEHGKPFVQRSRFRFNWSHSPGCVALAMAWDREVGVDIESVARVPEDFLDIAESLFVKDEIDWIGEASLEESRLRFLSIFVQKEAALKLRGTGFDKEPVDAPVAPTLPPAEGEGWALAAAEGRERLFIAVAAEAGAGPMPRFFFEASSLVNPPAAG